MIFSFSKVKLNDYISLALLLDQLGYKIKPNQVKERLKLILKDKNQFLYGAYQKNNLVGYIHFFLQEKLLIIEKHLEISSLIVKKEFKRKKIGSELLAKVENIAKKKSISLIIVRSNKKRKLAHDFYQNKNFKYLKEQKVFTKSKKELTKPL